MVEIDKTVPGPGQRGAMATRVFKSRRKKMFPELQVLL